MRGLVGAALTVSFCLGGAAGARAQNPAPWNQTRAPRPPLISPRAELLRPIGPTTLETLRLRPDSTRWVTGLTPARPSRDSSAEAQRVCRMPVARPDTTSLERMPVDRRDSARVAPMPVASGCANPLFR
jgi:hypothetical protein